MTELRLLPKPEGFDLRDKRSDKSNCGEDWLPQDAVYDAQQQMKSCNTTAVAVLWFHETADGALVLRHRFAGKKSLYLRLLMSALGREMGWDSK